MKFRILPGLGASLLVLIACAVFEGGGAPVTMEPTEAPIQPTEPLAPTAAPTDTETPSTPTEVPMPFVLTSTAFAQGEPIPRKFSCRGEDISPTLAWGDPPAGTQSLTLIMDDPDAPGGTWVHWIVFNIPADVRELPEDMPAGMRFDDVAATFGRNSWGRSNYGGPCPPSGTHRYFFKLYALDTTLPSDEAMNKRQLQAAMEGHILTQTELMGTFSR